MIISEYYSEDGTRSSIVVKEKEKFIVVCIGEGVNRRSEHLHMSVAEDIAEDWVYD